MPEHIMCEIAPSYKLQLGILVAMVIIMFVVKINIRISFQMYIITFSLYKFRPSHPHLLLPGAAAAK